MFAFYHNQYLNWIFSVILASVMHLSYVNILSYSNKLNLKDTSKSQLNIGDFFLKTLFEIFIYYVKVM